MPTRYIKESARTSKNLAVVSDFSERLFWRLITTADDFGRFLACPVIVKNTCFPTLETIKASKVEQSITELCCNELIGLYTVGDRQYGWFMNWEKHQGKPRALASKYPEIPPEFLQLQASVCRRPQVPADVAGHPNTNTDTNTDLKSVEEDFEVWWAAMPARGNKKLYRAKSLEFYARYVQPHERAAALLAAKAYAKHCQQENRLPCDPHRFLFGQKGELWREFIPMAKPVSTKTSNDPSQPKGPFVPPPPELMGRLKQVGVKIPSKATKPTGPVQDLVDGVKQLVSTVLQGKAMPVVS